MPRPTDIRVESVSLWFLPVQTRVPLKFGSETLTTVTCARVRVSVVDREGRRGEGWGETPLSVQWVWPSPMPYTLRSEALKLFTGLIARAWANHPEWGHPIELGYDFIDQLLPRLREDFNASGLAGDRTAGLPWLAALVCASAFDLAVHDAYGVCHGRSTYSTYGPEFLSRDLSHFIDSGEARPRFDFAGRFPSDFIASTRSNHLLAWHLVGGLDPLSSADLKGDEPDDGIPVLLADWIRTDGLRCLKVKLRGTDAAWDFAQLVQVAKIGMPLGVEHLSADFNCTVTDPAYVEGFLDRLKLENPEVFARLLYVEQPFPYELSEHPIDVHGVSARKPLFLDESAHDWREVRFGRQLGWTGVALKTCKTQTGAILSACWARAHGMPLMVQDLTNPMLAMIPHALLAAHVGTIAGVETNACQFYPAASAQEAAVHPGLYARRQGAIDLSSVGNTGFGYRIPEIGRQLPPATFQS